MTDRIIERTHFSRETETNPQTLGQAEELALAALSRQLDVDTEPTYTPITEEEISSRDAQRLTTNSRHNLDFLSSGFLTAFAMTEQKRS